MPEIFTANITTNVDSTSDAECTASAIITIELPNTPAINLPAVKKTLPAKLTYDVRIANSNVSVCLITAIQK